MQWILEKNRDLVKGERSEISVTYNWQELVKIIADDWSGKESDFH